MMHVLLTMANNTSTPYFNRFANIAQHQTDIQLSFLCLYPEEPEMIEEMAEKGLICHWIKYDSTHRKQGLVKAFFKIHRLLKKIKPDVVHGHLFDDSLPLLCAARLLGIKSRVISKLDAGFHYNYTPKWSFFDRMNNRNATHIIAVSGENKAFIIEKEKAAPDKVFLIHQGEPLKELEGNSEMRKAALKQQFGLEGKRIALTVSRYIEWKGYKYIIEAAEIVLKRIPDMVFLFFGYGEQKQELTEFIRNKNLSESILINDWIDRKDLNNLYEMVQVFVHAATQEPFGFVIAEAMLKKAPIVTTKTGAAYDAIEHKVNGYLVEKRNPSQLADGIIYMLENDTSEITENAYNLAKKMFAIETMWNKHIELYRQSLT